jgi:hypothetical protein
LNVLYGVPREFTLRGLDMDGDPLTFVISTSPYQGTLLGASPDFTYLPDSAFSGSDFFEFTASDGIATSAPRRVNLQLGYQPRTLSGNITLESCQNPAQSLTFEFRPTDGSPTFTREVILNQNGGFHLPYLPDKAYSLRIKGAKWLARRIEVDLSGGDVENISALLHGGDANNDNFVDVFDLDVLIQTFNKCLGDAGYDAKADFNCDDCADVFDLDLLIRNFNQMGDA